MRCVYLGSAIFLIVLAPLLLVLAIAAGPVAVMLLFIVACALGVFVLWRIPMAVVALGRSIQRSAKSHHAQYRSPQVKG